MTKEIWQEYNMKLLSIFFSIFIFVICFNVLIDPFCIFNTPKIEYINKIKTDKDRNQRITKIVGLKLDNKPLESIFLGSSRVNSSISEEYYTHLTGKNTKNLGMNALSHDETFKIAYNAILIHPEIKTIYIGLDFFRFLEKNRDNKREVNLSNKKELTLSEINPLLVSFNTTLASVNTLISNLCSKKNKSYDKKTYFIKKLKQYSNNYNSAKLADSEFDKLIKFKNEMENKGYNIIFYTNPTHVTDICVIKQLGYLPLFNEWKTKLAESFSYIDFDFVNNITTDEINENTKYFMECSHSTTLTGELIINYIVKHSNNYGKLITKENIAEHNAQNEKKLHQWEINNKTWTKIIGKITNNELQEIQ